MSGEVRQEPVAEKIERLERWLANLTSRRAQGEDTAEAIDEVRSALDAVREPRIVRESQEDFEARCYEAQYAERARMMRGSRY